MRGGAGRGGARGRRAHRHLLALSLSTSPQYFSDSAEAASWLVQRHKQLESASCGKDQADAEALLQQHLRLERDMRAFKAELGELEDQARAAAALVSLTVHTGTREEPRLVPPTPNVRSPQSIGATRSSPNESLCGPALSWWYIPPAPTPDSNISSHRSFGVLSVNLASSTSGLGSVCPAQLKDISKKALFFTTLPPEVTSDP